MKLALVTALALPLAACAGYSETAEAPSDRMPGTGAGMCDADAVQDYVGNDVNDAIGEEILAESGARTLRWGPPNSAWTMDYRTDRVNVRYDQTLTITEISCG